MNKVRLGDYVKIKTGKLDANASSPDGEYPFFTCAVEPLKIDSYSYDCECVLVAGNGDLNVKYYDGKFDAYQRTYIIESKDKTRLSVPYLYHFLDNYIDTLRNQSIGGVIKYIKLGNLTEATIDIPNIETQLNTIRILSFLDSLIEKANKQKEKLDTLVKSRFVEMFGEPVSNPMNWNKYAIGKRCNIITGNTPPRADKENYGSFIEWIKSDNINTPDTYLTTAEEYLSEKGASIGRYVESGSILMTCIAGSIKCIGNVGVANRRVAFNQQINAIVPKYDETMYIYWLMILSKSYIQSTINMALKGILSKGQLSVMEFPFPPLDLQQQFADFVSQIDKSKLAVQKSLEKLETLKKSLMQEYFG